VVLGLVQPLSGRWPEAFGNPAAVEGREISWSQALTREPPPPGEIKFPAAVSGSSSGKTSKNVIATMGVVTKLLRHPRKQGFRPSGSDETQGERTLCPSQEDEIGSVRNAAARAASFESI